MYVERDGKTRVFILGGDTNGTYVSEVYPDDKFHNPKILGEDAQEILNRTDYRGVYHWVGTYQSSLEPGHTEKMGYGLVDKTTNQRFDVSTKDKKEKYKIVAKAVEKRAKKKGLTIVLS